MTYVLFALGGLLLFLLGLFLLRARRRQAHAPDELAAPVHLPPQAQLARLQQAGRFWGISVESHCRASSPLAGRQFAFEAVPVLPVRECTEAVCECKLIGLPERRRNRDRRVGEDRRRSLRMEDDDDRRGERPRRRGDFNSWSAYRHL